MLSYFINMLFMYLMIILSETYFSAKIIHVLDFEIGNVYALLTVHPNTMIVFFYQLDAQILYFNTFFIFLYMFRALLCSSSGRQIVLVQHLVSSLSLGDCSVHRLRESSRNLCTEQSPKENDDTRCCTIRVQFLLLKISTIVLEKCRGI